MFTILAAAVVAILAIGCNIAVVACLVQTTRELRRMRQSEEARQREHFWRLSPMNVERRED